MKPNRLLARLLLQLSVLTFVLCAFAPLALAQTPGGTVPPITTAYVVTMVLGIVLGFAAQGLKLGNLLGLVTVPRAWAPFLAVFLTFGTGVEQGLTGQPTLTGAVWLNAIFTAFLGLISQAGGAALHGHVHTDKDDGADAGTAKKNAVDPVTAAANALPKPPASARIRGLVAAAGVLVLALFCNGCLADAPIVPVTPANQAQVSACESTAALHNDFVIGDFAFTGIGGGAGAIAAVDSNTNVKTAMGITAGIAGAAAIAASSIVALSSSNFASDQCTQVVGPLPAAAPAGAAK